MISFWAFGLLLPAIALPISFYGIKHNFKNWRIYIFIIAVFLSMVAYSYTPVKNEPDIIRYFEWAEQLADMSFREALFSSVNGQTEIFVMNLLLWLGGKSGDVHLIPAVSVFFVYFICFYITCYMAEKESISPKNVLSYIIFALLTMNYYAITNNVRNVLAFCLIGLAIFRDLYQGKHDWKTFLLYLMPITLHQSSIVMILLRLVLLLPGNYKVVSILVASLIMPITDILYKVTASWASSGNLILSIVRNMLYKAYWFYRNHNSEWAIAVANSGSHRLAKAVYITMAVILCLAIYIYQKRLCKQDQEYLNSSRKKYTEFVFYIGVLTIACAPMPMPEYWRFASAFLALGGGVFVSIYAKHGTFPYRLSKIVYILTPICLALWVIEFIKCDWGELVFGALCMNPVLVAIKDIIRLLFL